MIEACAEHVMLGRAGIEIDQEGWWRGRTSATEPRPPQSALGTDYAEAL